MLTHFIIGGDKKTPDHSFASPTEIATVLFISVAMAAAGCGTSKQADRPMPTTNVTILTKVNGAELWFHARKTRPIWVRLLEQEETVKTLDGEEQGARRPCRKSNGGLVQPGPSLT